MNAFEKLDIHGMTVEQAKISIDAKLRKNKGEVYSLKIVHGYHGGTALRDFVRKHYRNDPRIVRIELGMNPGETDFILREL